MSTENVERAARFKKDLSLMGGVSMLVGSIIGSGIFVFPQSVMKNTLSVWVSLAIWLAGGLVTIAGAFCYAELGTLFSKTGGEYLYIYEGIGALAAFLKIWVSSLVQMPGVNALLAQACAGYVLAPLFSCGPPTIAVKLLAIFFLRTFPL